MTAITLYHKGTPLVRQRILGERISIGSHPKNDLVLNGDGVCERHVTLSRNSRGRWFAFLGEGDGTEMESGSRLTLGSYSLELGDDGETTAGAGSRCSSPDETEMVGISLSMVTLRQQISMLAPLRAPVLVEGETGTGKELVARALHRLSGRPSDRFVAINCGALADTMYEDILFGHERGAFTGAATAHRGLFERAGGGTLFLDELGELPLHQQAALLRVLDTGRVTRLGSEREVEVDFRLVAATNRDIPAMVSRDRFRSDLYHRLSALPLRTIPLRARTDDVEPMARFFLERMADDVGHKVLSERAVEALKARPWPGNARELRNVLYRAAVLCGDRTIDADHLSFGQASPGPRSSGVRLADIPDGKIVDLLSRNDDNITRAAREIGVPRTSLRDRLRRARCA